MVIVFVTVPVMLIVFVIVPVTVFEIVFDALNDPVFDGLIVLLRVFDTDEEKLFETVPELLILVEKVAVLLGVIVIVSVIV